MSETAAETTATEATDESAQAVEEADSTDWKVEARKWESRAKENASAKKRLDQMEEASKTELQKLQERAEAAERERDTQRSAALRLRVAAKHGISEEDADLFLTGADEDTLNRQTQRLADRESERRKQGNHVAREGKNPKPTDNDERAAVRSLFNGGT